MLTPAILPGGDVPLARALAFIGLAQEVTQAALVAAVDRQRDADGSGADGSADTPVESAPAELSGPRPVTVAEQVGIDAAAPSPLSGFELFDAVVKGGWAEHFAAVMVWDTTEDGPPREVTTEEVSGPLFPTRAFAEAWSPFYEASAGLMTGLLHTRPATASSSTEATTMTPA